MLKVYSTKNKNSSGFLHEALELHSSVHMSWRFAQGESWKVETPQRESLEAMRQASLCLVRHLPHWENAAAVFLVQAKNKLPPPFLAAHISFMGAITKPRCTERCTRLSRFPLCCLRGVRDLCQQKTSKNFMPKSWQPWVWRTFQVINNNWVPVLGSVKEWPQYDQKSWCGTRNPSWNPSFSEALPSGWRHHIARHDLQNYPAYLQNARWKIVSRKMFDTFAICFLLSGHP